MSFRKTSSRGQSLQMLSAWGQELVLANFTTRNWGFSASLSIPHYRIGQFRVADKRFIIKVAHTAKLSAPQTTHSPRENGTFKLTTIYSEIWPSWSGWKTIDRTIATSRRLRSEGANFAGALQGRVLRNVTPTTRDVRAAWGNESLGLYGTWTSKVKKTDSVTLKANVWRFHC